MLRQIELQIKLPQEIRVNPSMGSVFHGALMDIIGPETANWLHTQNESRPFGQCVYYNRKLNQPIWRLSALSQEAIERILEPVLKMLNSDILLKQKGYAVTVESIIGDKTSSYQQLADDVFLSEEIPNGGSMAFLTPTSFKREGNYVIMPELYLIFQSVLNRWNYFSPKNKLLEKDLEIELAKSCFISSYDLHSQVFSLENSKITGFKGNMHIRFKANEMVRRILGMLLSYSQYAGIGIKTALGMGAVEYSRRIA